jgi:hypothetical protein
MHDWRQHPGQLRLVGVTTLAVLGRPSRRAAFASPIRM